MLLCPSRARPFAALALGFAPPDDDEAADDDYDDNADENDDDDGGFSVAAFGGELAP